MEETQSANCKAQTPLRACFSSGDGLPDAELLAAFSSAIPGAVGTTFPQVKRGQAQVMGSQGVTLIRFFNVTLLNKDLKERCKTMVQKENLQKSRSCLSQRLTVVSTYCSLLPLQPLPRFSAL